MTFLIRKPNSLFKNLIIVFNITIISPSALALTISSSGTINVIRNDMPGMTIFLADGGNANLNSTDLSRALALNNVKVIENNDDIVIIDGTIFQWSSPYNLTINAANNIRIGTDVRVTANGYGNMVFRADATGNTDGTLIPPSNNAGSIFLTGGSAKVFYRTKDFNTPTNFSNLIKVTNPGTLAGYMLINDFFDLQDMILNTAGYYALARNIDASLADFSTIGNQLKPFTGRFDGQGYKIDRLRINQPSQSYVGLFGYLGSNAWVQNVELTNANITGNSSVGGIVGSILTGSISNTHVSGNITGIQSVGGLVGTGTNFSISNSYAEGIIASARLAINNIGGIIGNTSTGSIINCYTNANIIKIDGTGTNYGGLAGYMYDVNVRDSYSLSKIVSGATSGGISGNISVVNTWKDVLWNVDTSEQTKPGGNTNQVVGVTGLTTLEMKQKETYKNWDFVNIWGMDDNNYPYLLWTKHTPPWTTLPNNGYGKIEIVG